MRIKHFLFDADALNLVAEQKNTGVQGADRWKILRILP